MLEEIELGHSFGTVEKQGRKPCCYLYLMKGVERTVTDSLCGLDAHLRAGLGASKKHDVLAAHLTGTVPVQRP